MNGASAHFHYNPDWLGDEALVANFVARQDEFAFLRDELARAPRQGSAQHYLLVGPRGAGKTTLLKRLAVALRRDADLNDHLLGLSFPEELFQVKNLADFWWAACDALADELDRHGYAERADRLLAAIDEAREKSGNADPLADAGLRLLLQTCTDLERRPVLLVDNLDLVFQRIDKSGRKLKDPHAPAYWALREALSTTASPIVIGGSVRLSEPFTDYDKAFYDFFISQRLGRLTLEEARRVLERLADAQGVPEVKERLHARPGRIAALYELTGGNPRALGLFFELLRQGSDSRAVEDFERLMDLTTPYYKARFEDLSEQAQVVMHALAVRRSGEGSGLRFGHTAAEIGAHAGLATGTVSAQLDILEREGLVEKSAAHGRTQYRIAEQLFRLWLQMRASRRVRRNVIGLAEFLEAMFDFAEPRGDRQEDDHPRLPAPVDAAPPNRLLGEAVPVPYGRWLEPASDSRSAGWKRRVEPPTRLGIAGAREVLDAGDTPILREALTRLLAETDDIAAALASEAFVEGFLAPALAVGQGRTLLAVLRDLGYDRHARPLLLACEAVLEKRQDRLADLEPEVRGAAQHMFARLTAPGVAGD